jgi:hypothetical protein
MSSSHTISAEHDFGLLLDRKHNSSCRCSARMNAWLLFFLG